VNNNQALVADNRKNPMFIKKHFKALVSTVTLLTLLGVIVTPLAYARITLNTINPTATVGDNGRRIVLTGPLQTDVVENIYLRVTVTQRTTGAVAEGVAILRGTGEVQEWEILAETLGKASFKPGPATAVAIAITSDKGQTSDAHQWLVNITLVDQ
jgi:hypothetical protein